MANAGFQCLVRKSGETTAVTTEPCEITSGTASVTFRIADSAKRVIDPNTAFHFKNGTATLAWSDFASLSFPFGEFVLNAAVADGSVTSLSFSGSYLPITTASDTILEGVSFSLNEETNLIGRDVFTGSSIDFVRKRLAGLKDFSLEVTSLASRLDLATLHTAMFQGQTLVTEVFFGDATAQRFRGVVKLANIDSEASPDGRLETTLQFQAAAARRSTAATEAPFAATYGWKVFP